MMNTYVKTELKNELEQARKGLIQYTHSLLMGTDILYNAIELSEHICNAHNLLRNKAYMQSTAKQLNDMYLEFKKCDRSQYKLKYKQLYRLLDRCLKQLEVE